MLNFNSVGTAFNKMKKYGSICYKMGRHDSSIRFVKAASWWAYYFNLAFSDEHLERITHDLSKRVKDTAIDYVPQTNNAVFFDSFAFDHRGLTQQYIRALMSMKYNLLFLTDAAADSNVSKGIYGELQSYSASRIVNIPSELLGIKRAQFIYDTIVGFQPCKVFMHLMPDAVETLMAMHALPSSIDRYQINLTDHTFWLGTTALDYSFEFRPYGMKASKDYRLIEEPRLLLCPYYPIIEKIPFSGFPFEKKKDDVVVFSGGSSYKFIDAEATYAQMVKRVLDEIPDVIWVHAGDGVNVIEDMLYKVMDETYRSRVYLLGHRNDIAEIFNHCDIYVNSYPVGGGLMSLYAAYYGKPILSLKSRSVDGVVGQLHPIKLSFDTMDAFCEEMHKLVRDNAYRVSKGEQVHRCIITEGFFNDLFSKLCTSHTNVLPYELSDKVVLPAVDKKIEYENRTGECVKRIVTILKWRAVFVSLLFIRPTFRYYIPKIKRKLNVLCHS